MRTTREISKIDSLAGNSLADLRTARIGCGNPRLGNAPSPSTVLSISSHFGPIFAGAKCHMDHLDLYGAETHGLSEGNQMSIKKDSITLIARCAGLASTAVAGPLFLTTIYGPGAVPGIPSAINNQGQIVGTYSNGGHQTGFLDSGTYTSIQAPGDWFFTRLTGISDLGQITGFYMDVTGVSLMGLFTPGIVSGSGLVHSWWHQQRASDGGVGGKCRVPGR